MKWRILIILGFITLLPLTFYLVLSFPKKTVQNGAVLLVKTPTPTPIQNPLSISYMEQKTYPGSPIKIEEKLADGINYHQYLSSYISDGLKIYALLTVPIGQVPKNGWPAIVINHGYIAPSQYSTINSYSGPVQALASAGFVTFKPDYRGNGNSEGLPSQVYISSGYVDDSMNAIFSIKKYQDVDPSKIGLWGHSMGGNVTLHDLVLSKDIVAAVLWSGVVGNYSQILDWWHKRIADRSIVGNDLDTANVIEEFEKQYGNPTSNPVFWNAIDPTQYLQNISATVQIDVGTADTVVPPIFSTSLASRLENLGKNTTLYTYPGADHNLSGDSSLALSRSISFFNKYLK